MAIRDRIAETLAEPGLPEKSSVGARSCSPFGTLACGKASTLVVVSELDRAEGYWIIDGAHCQKARGRKGRMERRLSFRYDHEGDILDLGKGPPCAAQESEELGDEIIARADPSTNEVENHEVFSSPRGCRGQSEASPGASL